MKVSNCLSALSVYCHVRLQHSSDIFSNMEKWQAIDVSLHSIVVLDTKLKHKVTESDYVSVPRSTGLCSEGVICNKVTFSWVPTDICLVEQGMKSTRIDLTHKKMNNWGMGYRMMF